MFGFAEKLFLNQIRIVDRCWLQFCVTQIQFNSNDKNNLSAPWGTHYVRCGSCGTVSDVSHIYHRASQQTRQRAGGGGGGGGGAGGTAGVT